jgi:hypothetical protein
MEKKMNAATTRSVTTFLAVLVILTVTATGQSKRCTSIGGVILTNLGVPDANSTMGYATGDLKGAVGVTILNTESNGNTLVLHVQHHWVSESGDVISLDPATATTTQVAPGLYAVVTYPFHINVNGTGKFAGVSATARLLAKPIW